MAIRVLLDHNVPEDKIALLSLLVSKQGKPHRTHPDCRAQSVFDQAFKR